MASKDKSKFTVNTGLADYVTALLAAGLAVTPVVQNVGPIAQVTRDMLMGAFGAAAIPQPHNWPYAIATGVAVVVPPLMATLTALKTFELVSTGSAALRGNIVSAETVEKETFSPKHRSPSATM